MITRTTRLGQLTAVNGYASTTTGSPVYSASYGYNSAEQLTSLGYTNASSSSLASYGYAYDADGRLTQETSVDGTTAYTYDRDSQLTGASGTALPASESYGYDANGNRTNTGDTTGANNELTSDGTFDYAYDSDGNLITKTTIATGVSEHFTWDYRNRLTEVTFKDAGGTTTQTIDYMYDVFNRRIGQTVQDGAGATISEEKYVYDGNSLLLVLDGSGNVVHTFLNGESGQALADNAGSGNVGWMLTDQRGSVRDVGNSAGSSLDHIVYNSYGNVLSQTTSANQPRFAYAGM